MPRAGARVYAVTPPNRSASSERSCYVLVRVECLSVVVVYGKKNLNEVHLYSLVAAINDSGSTRAPFRRTLQ